MNYIADTEDYSYIFLTLTAKNVKGEELSQELDKYFAAFKKLTERKEYKALAHGHFRCLEVTRNWITDEYHPHFHVIIAVNKSYFTDSRKYLSNEKWTSLWKDCMGLDYTPVVDVRKIKPPGDADDASEPFSIRYAKAVAEVAKYTVKVDDIILETGKKYREKDVEDVIRSLGEEKRERLTDETVKVLDSALKNRRLVAFGGELKKAHKALTLDDAVDGDLVNTDNNEVRSDLQAILIKYRWVIGLSDYFRVKEYESVTQEQPKQSQPLSTSTERHSCPPSPETANPNSSLSTSTERRGCPPSSKAASSNSSAKMVSLKYPRPIRPSVKMPFLLCLRN